MDRPRHAPQILPGMQTLFFGNSRCRAFCREQRRGSLVVFRSIIRMRLRAGRMPLNELHHSKKVLEYPVREPAPLVLERLITLKPLHRARRKPRLYLVRAPTEHIFETLEKPILNRSER